MADARPFLFLVVDAIPFEFAHELWEQGLLPGFAPPRPMISVFPSLTHVAVSAILRGVFDAVPKGYEARYFDPESGEVRGGFGDPSAEAPLEPLHGRLEGLIQHLAVYVLRRPLAQAEIRWITRQFVKQGKPWLAYVPATDAVGHFKGSDSLRRAFRDVCRTVIEARDELASRTGVTPGVVMCSDHGMAFGRFKHLSSRDLAHRLERAGFGPGEGRSGAVVLVPYGDVGGGVVYAPPARAPEVATVVAGAPGVDVAFARYRDGFMALARRGDELALARVSHQPGRYRYQCIHGDPLDYRPVWDQLACDGRLVNGWADDRMLLAHSWAHAYPDALPRVYHAMDDIVQSPAPVLFSMKDSWTYGPPLTHFGAVVVGGQAGTHGALSSAQSVGFAMCTEGDEPREWIERPALRPADVLRPWRDLVRAGSATAAVDPSAPAGPGFAET